MPVGLSNSNLKIEGGRSVVHSMHLCHVLCHLQMALDQMTMDSVEKAGQISHLREELRVSQMKIEGVIRENESTRRRQHHLGAQRYLH